MLLEVNFDGGRNSRTDKTFDEVQNLKSTFQNALTFHALCNLKFTGALEAKVSTCFAASDIPISAAL